MPSPRREGAHEEQTAATSASRDGQHTLFYYPYASFRDEQRLLLRTAALFFDRLFLLDPEKATGGTVGVGPAADDARLLDQHGILERVTPEEVIRDHGVAIAAAIRQDFEDAHFLELCEQSGRHDTWTIALAKVPAEIRNDPKFQPLDRAMQRFLGEVTSEIAAGVMPYAERYAEMLVRTADSDVVYDEYREIEGRDVEYRYADYPLPLGESIMINHALFGGLLHTEATPVTDDPFHKAALDHKLARARNLPTIAPVLDDRRQQRRLTTDQLARTALEDDELRLPAMRPDVPLEAVLDYRDAHGDELATARTRLAAIARRIREEPWTPEFEEELDHSVIPDLADELAQTEKARDSWLRSRRGRLALRGAGLGAGTAGTVVALVMAPTPLLPVSIALGALALFANTVVPGAELVDDWRTGKRGVAANGLNYLIRPLD